jgi:ubiquinone/menaquinone biosynthesis C-methylase UbiE
MLPKPKHLGPEYAAQLKDRSIVEAYHHRPPYPTEVFVILSDLITDEPRAVLDVGCGTGDIARGLVNFVDRVDAVDFSQGMIEKGKSLPGGSHPKINWMCGRVEEVELNHPYAMVTAGASLHWMDWDVVTARFQEVLTPRGYITIVDRKVMPTPWDAELKKIIPRFSTNQDYQPYDLIEELEVRHLFRKIGEKRTKPVPFVQPLDGYIEAFHSMNGLSRERMSKESASAFDAQVKELVSRFSNGGNVELQIVGVVVWGTPKVL